MQETEKAQWISGALKRHEASLLRYSSWILGDSDRAREIVQEVFLRLCKEQPSRLSNHLPQWLFTVCRNLSFDARRKEMRMTRLEDADFGIKSDLEDKQTVSEIKRIIQTLPKNQREVLYLKFQCDLSYKEISDVTKLSVSNVGFLIHTAVRSIRERVLPQTARRTP